MQTVFIYLKAISSQLDLKTVSSLNGYSNCYIDFMFLSTLEWKSQ